MHFVNQIDFVTSQSWQVLRVIQYFAHIINASIRRRIQFNEINKTPTVDFRASATNSTRCSSNTADAIQGFCKNTCDGGFAHAARTSEQIGMVQTVLCQRIAQCLHNMPLPRQLREGLGPPFAR